jgi:GxxExxY protein
VLFDVYNSLGPLLKELYYQDATLIGLEKQGIPCEGEKAFEVYYEGERVGLYYVDVWVYGGKMLVELKVAPSIEALHKAQAISYLKVTDADLALIASFGGPSLEIERCPNYIRDRHPDFVWTEPQAKPDLLYPELTGPVRRACHRVHFTLGPGFLHQVYRRSTMIELRRSDLGFEYIKRLPLEYQGHALGHQEVRLILVEGKVLLATYALREAGPALAQQLKAYLRPLGLKLGLLANFHGTRLSITPVRIG